MQPHVTTEPAARPSIFVSHSSSDRDGLGQALLDLLDEAVFEQQPSARRRRIFYTSKPGSIHFSDRFDRILHELLQSEAVLALATDEALKKPSVISEMAVAESQGKLFPLVARARSAQLLPWPFDNTHACYLQDPEQVQALVKELRSRFEIDGPLPEVTTGLCTAISELARKTHPAPQSPSIWRRLAPFVGAAGICLAGAYFGIGYAHEEGIAQGRAESRPSYHQLMLGKPAPLRDGTAYLVYAGTFPRTYLSRKLHEMHEARKEFAAMTGNRFGQPTLDETKRHFLFAIDRSGLFETKGKPAQAEVIVHGWDGVHYTPENANDNQVLACDREWRDMVKSMRGANQTLLDGLFDEARFALAELARQDGSARTLVFTYGAQDDARALQLTTYAIAPVIPATFARMVGDDRRGLVLLRESTASKQ